MSAAAVAAARVAGAHADDGLGERHLEPLGREPDAGERRAEVLLDVERERPQAGRCRAAACGRARSGTGEVTSRSMPQRKAARVLPDPVGARISVCSPAEIGPQPCACAGVGSAKEGSNHARTAGEKLASGPRAARPSQSPSRGYGT